MWASNTPPARTVPRGLSWRDVLALGHMDDASAALLSGRLMVQSPLQVAGLGTPKQLELLATVVPNLSRVCVLINPGNFNHAPMLKAAQISADTLGIVALPAEAWNLQELDAAFVEMTKQRAGAMMVIAELVFCSQAATYRRTCPQGTATHDVPKSRLRGGWWPNELRE